MDSIGVFQDLTAKNLAFEFSEVTTLSGKVTSGQTILASGSVLAATSGLEWIDVSIGSILLEVGKNYHFEFTFTGNSNQNFFYNNQDVPFTQGVFTNIEGTAGGNTNNFVIGAFRVNVVPEPTSALLLGLGSVLCLRRRS